LCLNLFPLQHRINRTINGVECRLGSDDASTPIAITVDGTYKQYFLHWLGRVDIFSGTITVQGYPQTEYGLLLIRFYHDTHYKYDFSVPSHFTGGNSVDFSWMTYTADDMVPYSLGAINCTPNFSKLFIRVYEPDSSGNLSWNMNNGLMICCPAENKADAVQVAKSFTSGPDSMLTQSGYWQKHPDGE